jgi:hypothetical protein
MRADWTEFLASKGLRRGALTAPRVGENKIAYTRRVLVSLVSAR